jgi:excinuclease ABC subunit A
MLQALSEHYKFALDKPFNSLSDEAKKAILYGSDDKEIEFKYMNDRGDVVMRKHPFEGIINNMQRRYKETESNAVREELAKYLNSQHCPDCNGSRLRLEARNVFIGDTPLPVVAEFAISDALAFFQGLSLSGQKGQVAEKILKEINERLGFLVNVGLNYLNLSRGANTLSGGEAQRIRLASQIGAGLVGVMYVLDEPSIGLHQRDNERLLSTLIHLRNLGNTVIVVEHDEDAIRAADFVIDIGPGAGVHGGNIIAQGTVDDILKCKDSLTGKYLSGKEAIEIPKKRHPFDKKSVVELKGASGNNLKDVDLVIPNGLMTCITGVSGSGKSTLINDTLYKLAHIELNGATLDEPSPYKSITGLAHLDKVIDIDQSPIGRTPRSNPATYTGIFTAIRDIFAATQESRSRGYKPGRFSFNVKGGRCEACQGDGLIKVEMHFLPDVYVPCDVCKSKRYNP